MVTCFLENEQSRGYEKYMALYTLDVFFMTVVIVVGGNNVRGKYGLFSKKGP